jgi:glutamate synthase (NADPH/NADH) small chain
VSGVLSAIEFEHTAAGADGRAQGTGETFTLDADQVLKAIGQVLVPGALDGSGEVLALRRGRIAVDAGYATSLPGVWAGGDCVGTALDLTVQAVEDGKRAAAAMHRALTR